MKSQFIYFIETIKKKKISFIDENENKMLGFFLKNYINKNINLGIKKDLKFYENYENNQKNQETIFFMGALHFNIYFKKNSRSNFFTKDFLKNLTKSNQFSQKKMEKLLLIIKGFENLSLHEKIRIFSLIKNSDKNIKFIFFIEKKNCVLRIFQKFFFFSTFKKVSKKAIFNLIMKKIFFKKKKTILYKKEKIILSQYFTFNSFISNRDGYRFLIFFFFGQKCKKLSSKRIDKNVIFKNFIGTFFLNFLKFIPSKQSNSMKKIKQSLYFFFYRIFFTKNQYFFLTKVLKN